jgi:peptidyl-prolyl cis-trans isomerase A (cyclophilin A)
MKRVHVLALILSLALFGCNSSKYADLGDGVFADIQTSKGAIVVKLEYQKTPVTVANFISLAEGESPFVSEEYKDKKYFDGLIFHRVMKDFMIQGGDPLASGMGGPGYKIIDEFNDSLVHDRKGLISMANPGPPNTNGSQFFITHAETPWLNGKHTIFGDVVVGLDVVDSIAVIPVTAKDKPTVDIVMTKVEIIRNGTDAKKFDAIAIMTDFFAKEGERLAALEKEKQAKMAATLEAKKVFVAELITQKSTAKALPSGLKILSLVDAKGDKPAMGSKVLVHYAGFLEDGTLFDTSQKEVAEKFGNFEQINNMHRGDFSASLMDYSPDAGLVAGFREGLLAMKIGDKIRIFIPPHLGYGEQGSGPIPPNANLVFDLEITGLGQ